MTTAFIIGLLTIIFILFYSLVNMLKQEAHMAGRYSRISVLANVADAACAIGLNELDAQLVDQESELFKALYKIDTKGKTVYKLSDVTKDPIEYTQDKFKELKAITDLYPGTQAKITLEVKYIREFPEAEGIVKNDKEKMGLAVVTARAWNASWNASQMIREKRIIKITCNAVPVLSRFSVFLRQANIAPVEVDLNAEKVSTAFNIVEVKEDGSGTIGGKPVTVLNDNGGKIGWVFLGGAEKPQTPILLNIAGGYTPIGEGHHLNPNIYTNTEIGNNGHGVNSDGLSNPVDDTAGHYESGFCTEFYNVTDNGRDIGLKPRINAICNTNPSSGGGLNAPSSVFHFFDSAASAKINNNIMMGNVYRAYGVLGVFQCQKSSGGGWQTVGFFDYVDAKGNYSCPSGVPYPGNVLPNPAPTNPQPLLSDQDLARYLFNLTGYGTGGNTDYKRAMSDVRVDYYFNSARLFKNIGDKLVPDAANGYCSMIPDDDYFVKQVAKIVDAKDKATGKSYSLNKFAFEPGYFCGPNGRETISIKKGSNFKKAHDDFFKEVVQNGKLKLNKVVYFEDKVEIPPITDVERGGIIVAAGDITVDKIVFKGRADFTQIDKMASAMLTIVSLGGKITIKGNGPVCAHLVSLTRRSGKIEGEITLEGGTLDIFGGMAANKITPKDFNKGGKIDFNPLQFPDPEEKDQKSYLCNEYAYSINLMPQIYAWAVTSE